VEEEKLSLIQNRAHAGTAILSIKKRYFGADDECNLCRKKLKDEFNCFLKPVHRHKHFINNHKVISLYIFLYLFFPLLFFSHLFFIPFFFNVIIGRI
jgi:hypothetical protein